MKMALSALLLALAVPLSAASCDPSEYSWAPARYYDQNDYVFHEGQWYRSQHWQSGHEPSAGLRFPWEPVEAGPEDCQAATREQSAQTAVEPPEAATSEKGEAERAVGRPVTVTPLKLHATSGDTQKAAEAPREPQPVVCFGVPDWQYSQTYYPGDKVVHEGSLYTARRDSHGDIPGSDLPPAWNPLGPCK